jgi:hypothetical protein
MGVRMGQGVGTEGRLCCTWYSRATWLRAVEGRGSLKALVGKATERMHHSQSTSERAPLLLTIFAMRSLHAAASQRCGCDNQHVQYCTRTPDSAEDAENNLARALI